MAILLEMVEFTGVWPQGLLDSYFAMIPKADGDSTPLGQRPLVFFRLSAGSGLPFGLVICGNGLRGGCLSLFSVWGIVCHLLKLGFPLLWTLRRFCPVFVGIKLHVMVADVIKSFDTVDRSILHDCTLGRLGLPGWFRKTYFAYHSQVRLRFKLAAGLGELWCGDGSIPQGCLLSMVCIVALYVPCCRYFESLTDVKPSASC